MLKYFSKSLLFLNIFTIFAFLKFANNYTNN